MLFIEYYAATKSLQSCPTLCDPMDGSSPGSPVPGILHARTLEWVAISFSNAWKWKVKVKSLSRVRLFATPWTTAYQAPPPWDFPGKSTGVGCHCPLWLNTIVKAKKKKTAWYLGAEWLSVYGLFTLQQLWLLGRPGAMAPWESTTQQSTSPGKDGSSKSKVWFLLNVHDFHTIMKSKNPRSKHHESGTVCI